MHVVFAYCGKDACISSNKYFTGRLAPAQTEHWEPWVFTSVAKKMIKDFPAIMKSDMSNRSYYTEHNYTAPRPLHIYLQFMKSICKKYIFMAHCSLVIKCLTAALFLNSSLKICLQITPWPRSSATQCLMTCWCIRMVTGSSLSALVSVGLCLLIENRASFRINSVLSKSKHEILPW